MSIRIIALLVLSILLASCSNQPSDDDIEQIIFEIIEHKSSHLPKEFRVKTKIISIEDKNCTELADSKYRCEFVLKTETLMPAKFIPIKTREASSLILMRSDGEWIISR